MNSDTFELLPDEPEHGREFGLLHPSEYDEEGAREVKAILADHLDHTAQLLAEFDKVSRGRWLAALVWSLDDGSGNMEWATDAIWGFTDE